MKTTVLENMDLAKLATQERQKEKKAYIGNIKKMVRLLLRDIKALEGLKEVCKTFDGKVINCRFNTAVKDATGYYISFADYHFSLNFYCYMDRSSESHIFFRATYKGSVNPYNNTSKVPEVDEWQWKTGDRMEAEKAAQVIDVETKRLMARIDELQDTTKQYAEYLRKARRVESLIKELNGYNYEIKNWAKEHDLTKYVPAMSIWYV